MYLLYTTVLSGYLYLYPYRFIFVVYASAGRGSRGKPRPSLGSISRGSANEYGKLLAQLCAYVEDGDSDLHFGTQLISRPIEKFQHAELPLIELVNLHNLADVPTTLSKKATKKMPTVTLVGKNETELQESLRNGLHSAVDTHASIGTAVEFMPPREFANQVVAFSNTGKADYSSTVRRMVFEVKSDKFEDALLLQMLERLTTSMDTSHLLKNVLVFGATPLNAFVFVGRRVIPTSRQAPNVKSLHLFRTTHAKILELWWRASYQCTPDSFLTGDASYVLHALQRMCLDPWLCRVRLCDWSQSRVYGVTLPSKVKWPKGEDIERPDEHRDIRHRHCIGVVADNAATFVLKVVSDNAAFEKEAEALEAVKPSFLLGTIPFSSTAEGREICDSIVLNNLDKFTDGMQRIQAKRLEQLDGEASPGWWRQLPNAPSTGGVVVMKFGELAAVPDTDGACHIRYKIFEDCLDSLRKMHDHKFCHTDVRLANILRFDDKFALVDFGEAVKEGSCVDVSNFSEDRGNLLAAGCGRGGARVLNWTYIHDYEMLARTCLLAPNTSLSRLLVSSRKRRRDDAAAEEEQDRGQRRRRLL